MTVSEIREVVQPSSRTSIEKDGTCLFKGWFYDIPETLRKESIKTIVVRPDLYHKEWEKRGLKKPLWPEETPDYKFSDLKMKLYYHIQL